MTVAEAPLAGPAERSIGKADFARALVGSAIGSTIEWYDYFLYGTLSAIVFAKLYFPASNPVTSQLLSLATFALAFVARPIGGVIFSHIGDRLGRKRTLVITLTMMGLSTVAVGLLPTYGQIGVAAPVLLTACRLLQGLALGGEWGGGLLLAVEYSPKARRGLFGAIPQAGALAGLALGNLATTGMNMIFPDADFLAYGWRIPFLLSIVLLGIGIWIRRRVDETPSFKRVVARKMTQTVPLFETLRRHWRPVLLITGAKFVETCTFFLFATFTLSYLVGLGYSRGLTLNIVLAAAVACVPMMMLYGWLSDRVGRKAMYMGGTAAIMLFMLPYFWLLNRGSAGLALLAVVVGFSVIWSTYGGTIGTLFAESFPPEVRYTGASLGYQLGAALVGGPLPLIATALLARYGGSYVPVALFVIGCSAVSLVCVGCIRDRTGQELDGGWGA